MKRRMQVVVVHVVNGTTDVHTYTCRHALVDMAGTRSPRGTVINFVDGRDAKGRVRSAQYRQAEVIIRREL